MSCDVRLLISAMMHPRAHSCLCHSPVEGNEEGLDLKIGLARFVCRFISNQ